MPHVLPASVIRRFGRYVDIFGACWLWTGGLDSEGYGSMWEVGRSVAAHRIAWGLMNGPIPAGGQILHRCDNPPCVRPDHLWLGTHADNMRDMAVKKRGANGNSAVMACPADHPHAGDNLYTDSRGMRYCRECRRTGKRIRRARQKGHPRAD